MWHICLAVTIAIVAVSVAIAFKMSRQRKNNLLSPSNVIMVGTFLSSAVMFVPIYADAFRNDGIVVKIVKTFFVSLHHSLRLFIVDSDFDVIRNAAVTQDSLFYNIYSITAAILFVAAPILAFGVVLSFFKNVSAHRRYLSSYQKDAYIFSKLNERSLALAKSIKEKQKNAAIVFTGVFEQSEEPDALLLKAKAMRAICFKKDIVAINFSAHSKKRYIKFFAIGDNETENVQLGLSLIAKHKNRENTWLYVFSNEFEGEVLLSALPLEAIKVRRVSDVRTLIYTVLRDTGEKLFAEAAITEKYPDEKLISALIVGLGKRGTEMAKTLAWFGQMDGYRLNITAVDKREDARDRFSAICPELMSDKLNGQFEDDGESRYKIDIFSGLDIDTQSFFEKFDTVENITYVFVDVGDDAKNIRTAIKMRWQLNKRGLSPRIQVFVANTEKKNALCGIKNHSGQEYDIEFVGDVESFYSVGSIIESELEDEALGRHLKWGNEEDFWKYEYNHRSSVASALHHRMKRVCKIPGMDKAPNDRAENERLNLRKLEHRRWNAYMRSEGYTYAKVRNNLAKTHNCLVTYEELTPAEKAKDDD